MISAIVLTKNEEKNIVDCLNSLLWCDEIIVIDDYSEDKTLELIQNFKNSKINIFRHKLNNDFSEQRNFGISKAKGEWVLFVDADERVSDALRYEIQYTLSSQNLLKLKMRGFYIRRIDFMWGKKLNYGETGNIKILRLAKKDAGRWEAMVHETWKIKRNAGVLKNPIYHYPHQTITKFLKEINFYTDVRAKELFQKNVKISLWSIIMYPKVKFFVNYFIKRGFLDGLPGLIFAIMMSFHSFLVRGKLWILNNKRI